MKRKLGVPKSTYRHNAQIGKYRMISMVSSGVTSWGLQGIIEALLISLANCSMRLLTVVIKMVEMVSDMMFRFLYNVPPPWAPHHSPAASLRHWWSKLHKNRLQQLASWSHCVFNELSNSVNGKNSARNHSATKLVFKWTVMTVHST